MPGGNDVPDRGNIPKGNLDPCGGRVGGKCVVPEVSIIPESVGPVLFRPRRAQADAGLP